LTSQESVSPLFRIITYSFLILISIYAFVMATRWMLADMALRSARSELESWSFEEPPDSADWQDAQNKLQRAISLKPNNAENYRLLGFLYEWQEELEDDPASRSDAVAAYRQAVQFRPGWPDDWVRFARSKAFAGELDDEFAHALNQALVLGTNEQRVEMELSYTISIGWTAVDLQSETADLMDAFIRKSLLGGGNYQQKLDYMETAGLLFAYCFQMDLESVPGPVRNRCLSL
jgi:tetratricopeptide (TPR) repeat protein